MPPSTLASAIEQLPSRALASEAPVLRLLLGHRDEFVRAAVIDRLGESQRTASTLTLEVLNDKSEIVRLTALRVLTEAGKLKPDKLLEVADGDLSPVVRAKACGIAVTKFRLNDLQSNLIRLTKSRNRLASSMALSYLDEAVDDGLLSEDLIERFRNEFEKIPPGIDPETREIIASLRDRIVPLPQLRASAEDQDASN